MMNVNPLSAFCLVLLALLAFSAGCTSSSPAGSPAVPSQATVTVTIPATQQPAVVTSSSLPPTPTLMTVTATGTAAVTPAPTATWIPKVTGATGDPKIVVLEFQKEYFQANLPDCGMRAAFPMVAADPGYGISGGNRNLTAYSEGQIVDFLQANAKPNAVDFKADRYISNYIEPDTLGGTSCAGKAASPTWNFVLINATLMGRNALPAEYAIGFDIRSKGTVVAEIRADRRMALDEPSVFALYVPLKTTETELFDSVELVFAKKQ